MLGVVALCFLLLRISNNSNSHAWGSARGVCGMLANVLYRLPGCSEYCTGTFILATYSTYSRYQTCHAAVLVCSLDWTGTLTSVRAFSMI
jgi:hypothetical protein